MLLILHNIIKLLKSSLSKKKIIFIYSVGCGHVVALTLCSTELGVCAKARSVCRTDNHSVITCGCVK